MILQLQALAASVHEAWPRRGSIEVPGVTSPEIAEDAWRLTLRGTEVFVMPRAGLLRSLLLNHWYHHRSQLSVYLRLLDARVPVIYGRSADENPFA